MYWIIAALVAITLAAVMVSPTHAQTGPSHTPSHIYSSTSGNPLVKADQAALVAYLAKHPIQKKAIVPNVTGG